MIHEEEILNWGPLLLFVFAIGQTFGGISLVVAMRHRRVLLQMAKAGIYVGFAVGFLLFAKVFECAVNLVPRMLPEATGRGAILAISVPVLSYWGSALMAGFCYKAICPARWQMYVETMRSKSNE